MKRKGDQHFMFVSLHLSVHATGDHRMFVDAMETQKHCTAQYVYHHEKIDIKFDHISWIYMN